MTKLIKDLIHKEKMDVEACKSLIRNLERDIRSYQKMEQDHADKIDELEAMQSELDGK